MFPVKYKRPFLTHSAIWLSVFLNAYKGFNKWNTKIFTGHLFADKARAKKQLDERQRAQALQ